MATHSSVLAWRIQPHKTGLPRSAKAIQALNEEQIQVKKVVIQNRMALYMLTAAQEGNLL